MAPGLTTAADETFAPSIARDSVRDNLKAMFVCFFVGSGALLYGLDFGFVASFQAMPGFLMVYGTPDPTTPGVYVLGTTLQQLIASFLLLGSFIGSLLAGPIGDFTGRKGALWIGCVLCTVATIIMISNEAVAALYVGRILLGIANGILVTFVQLYMQETMPANFRGVIFGFFQFWISLGSLLGSIITNFTAKILDKRCYVIPLGLIFIIPTVLSIGLIFLPESPRYLMEHGQSEKAGKSMRWLRGKAYSDVMIAEELEEMKAAIEKDKELAKSASILDMFRGTDLRRTILSVLTVSCQGASGSIFLISYGVYFFALTGSDEPFVDGIILTCLGMLGCLVSVFYIRYVTRRALMMTGSIVMGICMLIAAAIYTAAPTNPAANKCLLAFVVIYIFAYTASISPYAWVIGGEIPSQRLRHYTLGLAAGVGFFLAWLISFTAPYFLNPSPNLNWGAKYLWWWVLGNFAIAAYVYFFLPETGNKSLETIDFAFINKIPAREFGSYIAAESIQAREKALMDHGGEEKQAVLNVEHVT